ncbi:MAG: hypothetical protein ACR2N1_16835 [Rubripirellula sp.]
MNDDSIIKFAFRAIKTHGPESEEFPGIGLFAKHHSDELPPEYWTEHLGTEDPSLHDILSILIPLESDDEEEDLDEEEEILVDFTLPGDATQYLLSVSLNESTQIVDISMES